MTKSITLFTVWSFVFTLLLSCLSYAAQATEATFEEIEWIELMPREDLAILMDPPEFLLGIEDGSTDDNMNTLAQKSEIDEKAKRFNEVLKSERIVPEFDGKDIRIPGFIVPLESNEERKVTSFFIVPYFGACLHLPPPPPNQIIFGKWSEGVAVEDLTVPFWFEGKIGIGKNANEMGVSAYQLDLVNVLPF